MTWTYTNDPVNVQLDELRLLIGDVDGDDPQLTDEELTYYLTEEGTVTAAAVAAVRGLMALYARKVDKAVGDLKVSYSQRRDSYSRLLDQLVSRQSTRVATPFAGGISQAQKTAVVSDADRVAPSFSRDQFRHPGTEDQTEDQSDPLTSR